MDTCKVVTYLNKHEIDYLNNHVITNFVEIATNDPSLKGRIAKFSLIELLYDLHIVQEYDLKAYKRYVLEINNSKGEARYWGHRFELFFHAKLILNKDCFDNIRRGKDGLEPDFLLLKNGVEIGIELTSLQFDRKEVGVYDVALKIKDRILEKNNKKYASDKCFLAINITNLSTLGELNDFNLLENIEDRNVTFDYLKDLDFNYGCIFFLKHLYLISTTDNLEHNFSPELCIYDDTKEMNNDLKYIVNLLFPHKASDFSSITHTIHLSNI